MFRSSSSARPATPAPDNHNLTGLERAKLEKTSAPPAPARMELPPHPATPIKPARLQAAPPKTSEAATTAHLHVGPGVTLKGEILGCDTLRVEGNVEGNAAARQLIVCSSGSVQGTVDIQEGDVEGRFEGTLNVAGRLFLRATGRIRGTLSYGEIEVERGGEILGDIAVRSAGPAARSGDGLRPEPPPKG